jgi:hypothetical protein
VAIPVLTQNPLRRVAYVQGKDGDESWYMYMPYGSPTVFPKLVRHFHQYGCKLDESVKPPPEPATTTATATAADTTTATAAPVGCPAFLGP